MAQLPDWQPLDRGIGVPVGSEPGRVVAVVASERAVASGWGASAALDLARTWSAGGEKVILADGALHYPTLHSLAQIENTEGLSDAALFGASVRRVARPLDGGGLFLITAGTAVADANAVPQSPRWSQLLDGFKEAGVQLLLFVRDGDSGCTGFLGSATDIVVLADRGERLAAIRGHESRVRVVAGPAAGTLVGKLRPFPRDGGAAPGITPAADSEAPTEEGRSHMRTLLFAAVALLAVLAAVLFVVIL